MTQILGTKFTQPFSKEVEDRYGASIAFDARFQGKVKRFRRWQDAQAHLIGRLLLIEGWTGFGRDRTDIPVLQYSAFERPYFGGGIGIDFSIAHSGEYVLCALSDQGRVGVDIEKIRPIALEDMQLSFSEKGWAVITTSEHPIKQLFKYWTQKEAVMKADGRGMAIAERIETKGAEALVESSIWHLRALAITSDYYAHLASVIPIHEDISVKWIEF